MRPPVKRSRRQAAPPSLCRSHISLLRATGAKRKFLSHSSRRLAYIFVTIAGNVRRMTSARRDELPGLTGLRGLAALAVLGAHTRFCGFGYGYLGVDVFFVLSGFVLAYVYCDGVSPGSFLWARLARTLPTHWVATTAVGLTMVTYGHASILDVVLNLFGLRIVNSPTWSLIVEWYAYLLFPIIAVVPGIKRLPASLIIAVGAIGGIIGLTCTSETWQWPLQTLRGLGEFALGVGLFRAGWLPRSRIWTFLDRQPIRWLGDISYPLYLTNFLPLLIITDYGRRPVTLTISILSIIGTVGVATILHYSIETPLRRWLRSLSMPRRALVSNSAVVIKLSASH